MERRAGLSSVRSQGYRFNRSAVKKVVTDLTQARMGGVTYDPIKAAQVRAPISTHEEFSACTSVPRLRRVKARLDSRPESTS